MQIEELLRIVGGHYMALLLQKDSMARQVVELRAEVAQLKAQLEPKEKPEEGLDKS